ncbi:MAG: hypothetical protein ACYTFW_12215 [Planctomycetota bacterium]|jgi:DNA-binding MarR family transcriptional regulator
MTNTQKLITLGDHRKIAQDLLCFRWDYREKEEISDYNVIRFALSHIKSLIYSSRSSPLLDGMWRTFNPLRTKDVKYQIRNPLLFEIIKLMEFSVDYKGKTIDEIFPELHKRPDAKAIVFTDAGISYFEAAFKFVNDISKNIISYLQNSYMKHNKDIHKRYVNPFVFLRKTPTIDDLIINPEPDVIIKEWFELTLTGFKKLFPEQEYSQHKIEAEFNSTQKQLEYEYELWKKPQEKGGLSERERAIVLTEPQFKILKYLNEIQRAVAQVDIEQGTYLSKNTVSDELKILKGYSFAAPPKSKKRRVVITQKGKDYLQSLKRA